MHPDSEQAVEVYLSLKRARDVGGFSIGQGLRLLLRNLAFWGPSFGIHAFTY